MANSDRSLYVVGDSHSRFWLGHDSISINRRVYNNISVDHIGAMTAYASKKILDEDRIDAIRKKSERSTLVITSFGEIDCRAHIVKQAFQQQISIESVAKTVAARYAEFIFLLKSLVDRPIVVWGPPPSCPPARPLLNPALPVIGSVHERNYATLCFTMETQRLLVGANGIAFCSLLDDLLTTSGDTRQDALFDGCHLAQTWMPQASRLVIDAAERMGIGDISDCFVRSWPILEVAAEREISAGLTGSSSSLLKGLRQAPLGPKRPVKAIFSSMEGNDQYFNLDLQGSFPISCIRVFPTDASASDIDRLLVQSTLTGVSWDQYERIPDERDVSFKFKPVEALPLARFVKVKQEGRGTLAFSNLQVVAYTYDSALGVGV